MTKKQVKDLKAGDDLGNCVIVSNPRPLDNWCGQKNRMALEVKYGDKDPVTAVWGRYTTVSVKDKQTSL